MSREPIRVLHVDAADAVDVTASSLERAEDRLAVVTATSVTEGYDRVRDGEVDCVVSDYDVPGGDGLEFLREVRSTHPDIPFVLYTSDGSEEIASEAISADVSGYLRKEAGERPHEELASRIVSLVARTRSTEESDRRFRQIAENSNNVVWLVTADVGDFLYVNRAYEELWGLSGDELLEDPLRYIDRIHPEDREQERERIEQMRRWTEAGGAPSEFRDEYRVYDADGDRRWVTEITFPIRNVDGEMTAGAVSSPTSPNANGAKKS